VRTSVGNFSKGNNFKLVYFSADPTHSNGNEWAVKLCSDTGKAHGEEKKVLSPAGRNSFP
jgi:hypothetical protein